MNHRSKESRNPRGASARSSGSVTSKAYSSRVDIVNRFHRVTREKPQGVLIARRSPLNRAGWLSTIDVTVTRPRYGGSDKGDVTIRQWETARFSPRRAWFTVYPRVVVSQLSSVSLLEGRKDRPIGLQFLILILPPVLLSIRGDRPLLSPPFFFFLAFVEDRLDFSILDRPNRVIVAIFRRDVFTRLSFEACVPACLIPVRSFLEQAIVALWRVCLQRDWNVSRSRGSGWVLISKVAN